MKLSDYIIDFIKKQGTDTVFSLSGGMITHLEDSIFVSKKLKLVSVKHEQAGAFAAEGYARSSGKTGIAMGTSGPGATNMITGIGSAFFDSIPVIYITGQVNTNEITSKTGIRQTGFQEADIISMIAKITKFSYQITKPEEIRYILEKSFFLANDGRKGPVVLDIPMDIQRQEIDPNILDSYFSSKEYKNIQEEDQIRTRTINKDVKNIATLLKQSQRPVILVGGGCKLSNLKKQIDLFIKKFDIPVVVSLMGLDSVDHTIKNYIGMIGSYGNRQANIAIMHSDLLLVVGSRLDIRQTGAIKEKFCPNAKIIQIDVDNNELGYNIKSVYLKIHQDVRDVIQKLNTLSFKKNTKRLHKLIKVKQIIQKCGYSQMEGEFYNMNYIFETISDLCSPRTIFANDVGQTQMWASQSLKLSKDQQLLNCGGMGAMGFSLPAAMGAYFANPSYKIISLNGDGGFQLNIQELETIAYHKIPLLIVVVNNHSLGMVREFQEAYFGGRNIGTVIGYSCPDISKITKAYGFKYEKIGKKTDVKRVFKSAINEKTPTILEIIISENSKLVPKIMFGNTIDNQSPELDGHIKLQIKKILS